MLVYVLNKHGKPLMPCGPAKARILLKNGKAKVVKRTPFTIQLLHGSSGYKQAVTLGVDSGYKHIGVSAITDNKELFSAEVELRTNIKDLLTEKRMYRRNRRSRLWHRKPRFLNRKRTAGWLAPSVQHKADSHVKLVNFISNLLPITKVVVEVASFDIQKIKNPAISGKDYQNGDQTGFWNAREYVLHRDGHTCQICKGKSKDKILNVHHIKPRSNGGADRPDNLITLCETCHKAYHKGKLELKVRPSKEFKAETFMSMVRWKIVNTLRDLGYAVSHTYGYITKSNRIANSLPKSHATDAFVIAGGSNQQRADNYAIRFVRKCNRSLFKSNLLKGGKKKVNTIKQAFGFQRFDKVMFNKIECFIHALRTKGYFDLRTIDGVKVNSSAKYTNCSLLERAKTMLIQMRHCSSLI